MLAAEMPKAQPRYSDAPSLLALLSVFDDRSPRLAAILESATTHANPETRYKAAAMRERF